MEQFPKQIKNPWVTGVIGLVIGAVFGLVVLGWWWFPVEWTDAVSSDLNSENQAIWIQMAASEYQYTQDPLLAMSRYDALGNSKQQALIDTSNNLGALSPEAFAAYVMIVEPTNAANIMMGILPDAEEADEPQQGGLTAILTIFLGIMVAILAAVGIFFILRKLSVRQEKQPELDEITAEPEPVKSVSPTDVVDTPFAQFLSTYREGDDLYDDSFSIDSPQGEFLGECGAGISEPIGVGDPKKVTAIDVWLFDKNDIQTVTKVLMSSHAYSDDGIRNRLVAKGEPILVSPGDEIFLETQTLKMQVTIVDMAYGEGPLPPESYFERMVLELSVWEKRS